MTVRSDKLICVGVIVAAHGIKGQVKFKPYTQNLDGVAQFKQLRNKTDDCSYDVLEAKPTKQHMILRLKGIDNRNSAEALIKTELYVLRDQLVEADEEEYYHSDLMNLSVNLENGETIARVKALQNFGAGDLIEIEFIDKKATEYIPFSKEFVPVVNLSEGYITVSLPDDIFEK